MHTKACILYTCTRYNAMWCKRLKTASGIRNKMQIVRSNTINENVGSTSTKKKKKKRTRRYRVSRTYVILISIPRLYLLRFALTFTMNVIIFCSIHNTCVVQSVKSYYFNFVFPADGQPVAPMSANNRVSSVWSVGTVIFKKCIANVILYIEFIYWKDTHYAPKHNVFIMCVCVC